MFLIATLNGKESVMISMVSSVYSFFSSPRNSLCSVLLLGHPSLGKYLFKERYDQKWKWKVSVLALGIAILSTREREKMSLKESCLISLALLYIGHAIAHYAFSQPRSKAEVLHKVIAPIKSDSKNGSGALIKDEKLGYLLLTVEHVVDSGATADIQGIEISLDILKQNKKCYKSGPDILLFLLPDIFENQDGSIPMTLAHAQLQIGEKVYFGGYPFKETGARLHMGHISHIGRDGKIGIDGTAVPGMSGGPIAVERRGKLYVVGTIASETFDPIEGFSNELAEMYEGQIGVQARRKSLQVLQQQSLASMQSNPQFTRINRDQFYISSLDSLKKDDPDCFKNMWDDLKGQEVISNNGEINSKKIISGALGLRSAYVQYEKKIIKCLKARTNFEGFVFPNELQPAFVTKEPTDSINSVSLSLVQSLSTGLITAHLLQDYHAADSSEPGQESKEFEIGKKKSLAKKGKELKKEGNRSRAASQQSKTFVNTGAPSSLYRFVSKDEAKSIKKDGIIHSGGELDGIPFLTQPKEKLARSVGAVSTGILVTVFPDLIPGLSKQNVGKVSERNGVVTYRINKSIPKEAIKISNA